MNIPPWQGFLDVIFKIVANYGSIDRDRLYEEVAKSLKLTNEQKSIGFEKSNVPKYKSYTSWASIHLRKADLIDEENRQLSLTDFGKKVLEDGVEKITEDYLKGLDNYQMFSRTGFPKDWRKEDDGEVDEETDEKPVKIEQLTPEEQMESISTQLMQTLTDELIETVKSVNPTFFERMVIDLLVAMGYGGSREDAGRAIGRSGDEGVDGVINEDSLGLDKIYIQAKRWQGTVGRPEIQKFVGSLAGFFAEKGVFITTGKFSDEAQDYVRKVGKHISLIDGRQLAQLMIKHNLGVRCEQVYQIKRVDGDYFPAE
ncbi:MAG TPA: restriction endonuclease [Caldisericia bacterium]|nr:restriction endonuclease [Caldisericia bacterium]HPF49547.1 restriction endonuclease [Caldisericia bacterium]HPI84159.1 restriction endonuclease [Caldisericia bacterium]HPQ93546.1 restriction endonuclease [Caldisericia bacterium]HRV75448.1 restriction endonuclease [Caldisericia bacterium]